MQTWYTVRTWLQFVGKLENLVKERSGELLNQFDFDEPEQYPVSFRIVEEIDNSHGKMKLIIAFLYPDDIITSEY